MALYFFCALFPVLLLLLISLGQSSGGSEWRGVLPPDASALMTQTIQQLNARAVLGAGARKALLVAGSAFHVRADDFSKYLGLIALAATV